MDVNGARVLQRRLGPNRVAEARLPALRDVPEDAPPVYRWLGVAAMDATAGAATAAPEAAEAAEGRASWLRRLGLGAR